MDGLGWKETDLAWACNHITQISSFTNQKSRYTAQQAIPTVFWSKHSTKIFVELISFDMTIATLDTNMRSNNSNSFTNTYNLQMYATEDRLILASIGYYYKKLNDGTPTLSEYTYRMTLNPSRAEIIPSPSRCFTITISLLKLMKPTQLYQNDQSI
jgi:hypothetical protein